MGEGVVVLLSCPRRWIVPVWITETGELHSASQVQMRHLKLYSEIPELSHSSRCLSLVGAVRCVSVSLRVRPGHLA